MHNGVCVCVCVCVCVWVPTVYGSPYARGAARSPAAPPASCPSVSVPPGWVAGGAPGRSRDPPKGGRGWKSGLPSIGRDGGNGRCVEIHEILILMPKNAVSPHEIARFVPSGPLGGFKVHLPSFYICCFLLPLFLSPFLPLLCSRKGESDDEY